MPIELTMPRLSDTMESGTIIKWNIKEGDKVSSGQPIADIETDKATMEMQAYDDGVVAKLVVPEGKQVPIGTVIALIAEKGEDPAQIAAAAPAAATSAKATPAAKVAAPASSPAPQAAEPKPAAAPRSTVAAAAPAPAGAPPSRNGDGDHFRISPVARRLAEDAGLDPQHLQGSGPSGRVIKRDILAAIDAGAVAAPRSAPAPSRSEPAPVSGGPMLQAGSVALSGMRQTIARRLVESKTTIPHYQVSMRFNLDPLLGLRSTLNSQLEAQGVKLSVNDFLVRACAVAIHQHPEFNARWGGDHIDIAGDVNVGVAISLPRERGGGLVVGTIRNADAKGLRQISQETRQLAEKARTKGLSMEDMSDSTFTISNLGMYGIEHFTAIINPPNVAILAVGAAVEQPVVRDGQIVVGHDMIGTLSLDHRVIDGAMAAEYMQTLKKLIENPATLLV